MASSLVLGTAQLGMKYGVANRAGQPDDDTARSLVERAIRAGFRGFDTAQAYGESEAVLGRAFRTLGVQDTVEVVSKGRLPAGKTPLRAAIANSCAALGVPRLSAWLLHDEKELANWNDRWAIEAAVLHGEGVVGAVGISVYTPAQAVRAVEVSGLGVVQFPASPFDRRFFRHGVIERLSSAGATLYIRSIYLQGLALMAPAEVPAGIPQGRVAAETLQRFCAERGYAADQFCLHYVLHRIAAADAAVVLGVDSLPQLERNVALANGPGGRAEDFDAWDALWPDDIENLVLPFRWKCAR